MGASTVQERLPALVEAVRDDGRPVTWVTDPMHGNTISASNGMKTGAWPTSSPRSGASSRSTNRWGTKPGGIHVELTGDDVTEVLGGSEEIVEDTLPARYETLVDPRLNHQQSLEMAFEVAEMLRR